MNDLWRIPKYFNRSLVKKKNIVRFRHIHFLSVQNWKIIVIVQSENWKHNIVVSCFLKYLRENVYIWEGFNNGILNLILKRRIFFFSSDMSDAIMIMRIYRDRNSCFEQLNKNFVFHLREFLIIFMFWKYFESLCEALFET